MKKVISIFCSIFFVFFGITFAGEVRSPTADEQRLFDFHFSERSLEFIYHVEVNHLDKVLVFTVERNSGILRVEEIQISNKEYQATKKIYKKGVNDIAWKRKWGEGTKQ